MGFASKLPLPFKAQFRVHPRMPLLPEINNEGIPKRFFLIMDRCKLYIGTQGRDTRGGVAGESFPHPYSLKRGLENEAIAASCTTFPGDFKASLTCGDISRTHEVHGSSVLKST